MKNIIDFFIISLTVILCVAFIGGVKASGKVEQDVPNWAVIQIKYLEADVVCKIDGANCYKAFEARGDK